MNLPDSLRTFLFHLVAGRSFQVSREWMREPGHHLPSQKGLCRFTRVSAMFPALARRRHDHANIVRAR